MIFMDKIAPASKLSSGKIGFLLDVFAVHDHDAIARKRRLRFCFVGSAVLRDGRLITLAFSDRPPDRVLRPSMLGYR